MGIFDNYYINYPPNVIDFGKIIVREDQPEYNYIDLLRDIVSDQDNETSEITIEIDSISQIECGFILREGRYIDIIPQANWSGESIVNLSINDGVITVFTELIVDVKPENDAPTLVVQMPGDGTLNTGEELDLNMKIDDIDSDLLEVTISSTTNLFLGQTHKLDISFGTPLNAQTFDWDGNGNLIFKSIPKDGKSGVHTIEVMVNDGNKITIQSVNIEILEPKDDDSADTILGMESQTFALVLIFIIIVIIIIFVFLFVLSRRGKGDLGKERPVAEDDDSGAMKTHRRSRKRVKKTKNQTESEAPLDQTPVEEDLEELSE
jgi:hypothetical protein